MQTSQFPIRTGLILQCNFVCPFDKVLHIPLWLGDVPGGTSADNGTRGRENKHTQDTNNVSISDWILVQKFSNLRMVRLET